MTVLFLPYVKAAPMAQTIDKRTARLSLLSDPLRKNDALFLYGAHQPKPFIFTCLQDCVEVVYGPSCKPENEIYLDRCQASGVAVHKRRTGGGTVVLSPGMVITIIVGERWQGAYAPQVFSKIHDAMIVVLAGLGSAHIQKSGLSDLSINGKKILGSSLYLQHDPFFFYYQSSLMVASDLSLLSRYLKHPPREPHYRQGRPHGEFCTTLNDAGYAFPPESIALLFQKELKKFL